MNPTKKPLKSKTVPPSPVLPLKRLQGLPDLRITGTILDQPATSRVESGRRRSNSLSQENSYSNASIATTSPSSLDLISISLRLLQFDQLSEKVSELEKILHHYEQLVPKIHQQAKEDYSQFRKEIDAAVRERHAFLQEGMKALGDIPKKCRNSITDQFRSFSEEARNQLDRKKFVIELKKQSTLNSVQQLIQKTSLELNQTQNRRDKIYCDTMQKSFKIELDKRNLTNGIAN